MKVRSCLAAQMSGNDEQMTGASVVRGELGSTWRPVLLKQDLAQIGGTKCSSEEMQESTS